MHKLQSWKGCVGLQNIRSELQSWTLHYESRLCSGVDTGCLLSDFGFGELESSLLSMVRKLMESLRAKTLRLALKPGALKASACAGKLPMKLDI